MKTARLAPLTLSFVLVASFLAIGISQVRAQAPIQTDPANQPTQLVAPETQTRPSNQLSPAIGNPDAPDQVTLTAIPPRLGDAGDLKAKPGEKIQTVIRVRNSSDEAMSIQSVAQDFIIGEDGTTPIPVSGEVSNRWSLASWILISPETQVIPARQTAQVNVVIDVPQDALPGGHYAMVMHQPSVGVDQNGQAIVGDTASLVSQRVGTLVYFMVEGPVNEEAFLRNINFPSFTEYGPVPFSFTVENVSDIHVRPQITVDIYNLIGQKVDSINVEAKNVFPYVSRDFDSQWDRVWGIGPYTAKFTMSFGSQGKVVMASSSFWLMPAKLVLAALTIIVVLIGLIVVIRRHLLHRQSNEQARIKMLEQRLAELETTKVKQFEE